MKSVFLLCLCCMSNLLNGQYAIIPQPVKLVLSNKAVSLAYDVNSKPVLELNTEYDSLIGAEGYYISVTPHSAILTANTQAGLSYAKTTFQQLVLQSPSEKNIAYLPCLEITDYPAFHYRGAHLDVSRHYFDAGIVKRFIDTMALLKLNYFHWHLTDDQGWRLPIMRYPLLTEVGGWRVLPDGQKYGGYYTREDIKDIVAYAAEKHITIIPEIDIPGHSSAAIAAYPWLSCHGREIPVQTKWGIHKDILCPSDTVLQFLKHVLDEVCDLFPSPYIHIGGDEVPKNQWKQSEKVARYKKQHGLQTLGQVQQHFIQDIEGYLHTKGRRAIGWGEVTRSALSDSMVVMSWRGKIAGARALRQGNEVIMASRFRCYLDYPQNRKESKAAWWMTYTPLKKVYHFNLETALVLKQKNKRILGAECTVWTEYIPDENRLWHQFSPRIYAFGEAVWSRSEAWRTFKNRLEIIQKCYRPKILF